MSALTAFGFGQIGLAAMTSLPMIDRIPLSITSRSDLIRNTRATARPQDLADAAALEALGGADGFHCVSSCAA